MRSFFQFSIPVTVFCVQAARQTTRMRTSELRVVLICLLCVANSEPNPPRLSCYPGKLCTELDRVAWLEKRKQVQKLTELLKKTPESEIYSE